jgi:Fic family protein
MKYAETHPWIKFTRGDLSQRDDRLWLQLGEIASKCEHLAGVPLRPEVADGLHKVFLAKGVLATTAIEGNTLSEEQVLLQIEGKLKLPPSQRYLQQEVQNILDVCNEEVAAQLGVAGEKMDLCPQLIKTYNWRVLKDLEVDDDVVPGEIRKHSVGVGRYLAAPWQECEHLLDRLCQWLNSDDFKAPSDDLRIPLALLKAVVAHVYLAWIHAFGDGNGRTARLVEFHILFSNGVPLPAAHLLSDHYNRTRSQYYRELDRASKSGGDLLPFVKYATQGFLDGLRDQLGLIRRQQMIVAWENYVHGRFQNLAPSPTQKRRRHLALVLPSSEWVSVNELPQKLPAIGMLYAVSGGRMLQRDLNALSQMGLVERHYGKVMAKRQVIQAFLPRQVPVKNQAKKPASPGAAKNS